MTKKREVEEFKEKVSILEVVFPNIPKVKYYGKDDEEKNSLKVMQDNQIVDLKYFNEILIVGNTVINVAGNSVTKNLETVVCVMMSLNCQGFIGYLV